MSDPYKVLGLTPDATEEQVKAAYRKLAMQYHPDRNPGDKAAEEKFKEINAANDAIKNGNTQADFVNTNFHDIRDFADFVRHFHQQQQKPRNRDIEHLCRINLEDAFSGIDVDVMVPPDSNGNPRSIPVKIPAGVSNGDRIRVPQAGENVHTTMKPGDLYVIVAVLPHSKFTRQRAHLFFQVDVDAFDIMLEKPIQVTGIDGKTIEVTLPAGFTNDQQLRVSGHGMPLIGSADRGDLFVTVNPVFPVLTEGQKKLIERAKNVGKLNEKN